MFHKTYYAGEYIYYVLTFQRKRYADDYKYINLTVFDPNRPTDNNKNKWNPPKDTVSEIETVLRSLYMDHTM